MQDKVKFFISKLVAATLTVIPMTFVMTAINTGVTSALLKDYPRNLLIAFLTAFPCSLLVHPLANAITKGILKMFRRTDKQDEI